VVMHCSISQSGFSTHQNRCVNNRRSPSLAGFIRRQPKEFPQNHTLFTLARCESAGLGSASRRRCRTLAATLSSTESSAGGSSPEIVEVAVGEGDQRVGQGGVEIGERHIGEETSEPLHGRQRLL
jgi:hypothetical protein